MNLDETLDVHTGVRILGVDCATRADSAAVAMGIVEESKITLESVVPGTEGTLAEGMSELILAELREGPLLLALDAPLGWPASLGTALVSHRAGQHLGVAADRLFARETDRFVQRRLRKTPMEVGASWLARTADAALVLLQQLRERSGQSIPLAWRREQLGESTAIEVYPAATLIGRGIDAAGYKGGQSGRDFASEQERRTAIAETLHPMIKLEQCHLQRIQESDHCLDAVICVLAGADFVRGVASGPRPRLLEAALIEGWIWFYDERSANVAQTMTKQLLHHVARRH